MMGVPRSRMSQPLWPRGADTTTPRGQRLQRYRRRRWCRRLAHTRTHAHTHARTHARACTPTCQRTHAQTHTHTRARARGCVCGQRSVRVISAPLSESSRADATGRPWGPWPARRPAAGGRRLFISDEKYGPVLYSESLYLEQCKKLLFYDKGTTWISRV
jgi:hypothetical protein